MSGLVGTAGSKSGQVGYTGAGVVAFCTGQGLDVSNGNPLAFSGTIGTSALNHGQARYGDSGTYNIALGASFNIKAAIRSSTGAVKIFFEVPQPDRFYGVSVITEPNSVYQERARLVALASFTTTSFEFRNQRVDTGADTDPIMFSCVVFR